MFFFFPLPTFACDQPLLRKEWRTLSKSEQSSFNSLVSCVESMKMPAVTLTNFLPLNRVFTLVFHAKLTECGYKGPMPFWDITADSTAVDNAPIWNIECKDCHRDHSKLEGKLHYLDTASMTAIENQHSFKNFSLALQGSLAGVLTAIDPKDPIVLLVLANVDRIWSEWQQEHSDAPLNSHVDLGGIEKPYGMTYSVNDILFTRQGYLCYDYEPLMNTNDSPYYPILTPLMNIAPTKDCLDDALLKHFEASDILADIQRHTCRFRDAIKAPIVSKTPEKSIQAMYEAF